MTVAKYSIGGLIALTLIYLGFNFLAPSGDPLRVLTYSEFLDDVGKGQIRSVEIDGRRIEGKQGGTAFVTYVPEADAAVDRLLAKKVQITAQPANGGGLLAAFIDWLPLIIGIFALWLFVARPLRLLGDRIEALMKEPPPGAPDKRR